MDWSSIIVGVLALCGTLGGSYMGVRNSNRLVEHRLKSLEEKVNKHNSLVERITRVEDAVSQNEERIRELESLHLRTEKSTFAMLPA